MLLKASEVVAKYKISDETLAEWDRLAYLRPVGPRVPGKHRLYYEPDIVGALEAPSSYLIRFDNYATLSPQVNILGTMDIGEQQAWWGDHIPDDIGWAKIEMGIFERSEVMESQSEFGEQPLWPAHREIRLKHPNGMNETGIISSDNHGVYVRYDRDDDDNIVLKTQDFWKEDKVWMHTSITNKQSRVPNYFWSQVVIRPKDYDGMEIKNILYTLKRKF
jgi:hypothetical protein